MRYLRYGLGSKARVRHPGIHLPKSDSGKYTIQARVERSETRGCWRINSKTPGFAALYPGYVYVTRILFCQKHPSKLRSTDIAGLYIAEA